jgi:S-sulfo-L-cysteine synthase (O-acetyl-L-serine-dependent)
MSPSAQELTDLIGNTPLFLLRRVTAGLPPSVEIYLKAEWCNPGGSVKDRAARHIVLAALADGRLKPGGTLLDASSGNTGIAYAMLGAAMGFKVTLCMPANANIERKRTLAAYGTDIVLTDANDGSDGAIRKAHELVGAHPERYFYADQYSNPDNWRAHYETTGPEIDRQTGGRVTHFVSGLGTSGTAMGVSRYFRDKLPRAQVVAFEPDGPFHGLEGLKHMVTAIVPAIYDKALPHQHREAGTERAYELARACARDEGLFMGISAGAAVAIALELGREEAKAGRPAVIVALAPDGGGRYLSEHFWDSPSAAPVRF